MSLVFSVPGFNIDLNGNVQIDGDLTVDGSVVNDGPALGALLDPGDAGALPPSQSGYLGMVSAAAETRTLAAPSAPGLMLTLVLAEDGGDVVVTCAAGFNAAGNDTATFNAEGDTLALISIPADSGPAWRVLAADGAALTTA